VMTYAAYLRIYGAGPADTSRALFPKPVRCDDKYH